MRRLLARLRRPRVAGTQATVGTQAWTLPRLAVIAGPETAARLGVPVGSVVEELRFDDNGELIARHTIDDQEVAP